MEIISPWDLEDTLEEVIMTLESVKHNYADHHDFHVNIDWHGHDGAMEISISGARLETDKERDKRLEQARQRREKKAEAEKQLNKTERLSLNDC